MRHGAVTRVLWIVGALAVGCEDGAAPVSGGDGGVDAGVADAAPTTSCPNIPALSAAALHSPEGGAAPYTGVLGWESPGTRFEITLAVASCAGTAVTGWPQTVTATRVSTGSLTVPGTYAWSVRPLPAAECAPVGPSVCQFFVVSGTPVPPAGSRTIAGTVTGLGAQPIGLALDGAETISVAGDGRFVFARAVPEGQAYAVSIAQMPGDSSCAIANGTGIAGASDVESVQVTCVPATPVSDVLDPRFGQGGIATVLPLDETRAGGLAVDAQGRVLIAVRAGYEIGVVRLSTTGQPDLTFGAGGVTYGVFEASYESEPSDLAVDDAGRIFVGGSGKGEDDTQAAVLAVLPNGGVDTAFGRAGSLLVPIGAGESEGVAVVARAGGGVVLGARAEVSRRDVTALVAITSVGALDPTFGGGGPVIGGVEVLVSDLVRAPDGGLVVVGTSGSGVGAAVLTATGALDRRFAAPAGQRTHSFGAPYAGAAEAGRAWVDAASGQIRIAASAARSGAAAILGLTSTGAVDLQAFATSTFATEITVAAVQADGRGRLVVAGSTRYDDPVTGDYGDALFLARFTAGGALDPSFGSGGVVVDGFGFETIEAVALAAQADGRVLVLVETDDAGHQAAVLALRD